MNRKALTFGVLAAALVAVSVAVGLAGGGGNSGSETPLQLERGTGTDGRPELLVTVSNDFNVASNAKGPTVDLQCRDAGGSAVIDSRHSWPLVSDGNPPAPHIHQPASQIELGQISRCKITGTTVELSGRLGLR